MGGGGGGCSTHPLSHYLVTLYVYSVYSGFNKWNLKSSRSWNKQHWSWWFIESYRYSHRQSKIVVNTLASEMRLYLVNITCDNVTPFLQPLVYKYIVVFPQLSLKKQWSLKKMLQQTHF